jgi:hypothetical protein
MATTKAKAAVKAVIKAPAKIPAKAIKQPVALKTTQEPTYHMPVEVRDWIERTTSMMNHMKGEITRLKQENKELKAYKSWATHRILRSDMEE